MLRYFCSWWVFLIHCLNEAFIINRIYFYSWGTLFEEHSEGKACFSYLSLVLLFNQLCKQQVILQQIHKSTYFRTQFFWFPVLDLYKCSAWIFFCFVIPTFTSEVSLWQFLHERAMDEKVRSGWSNLLLLAIRKNVVKGSWRKEQAVIGHQKDIIQNKCCDFLHPFLGQHNLPSVLNLMYQHCSLV